MPYHEEGYTPEPKWDREGAIRHSLNNLISQARQNGDFVSVENLERIQAEINEGITTFEAQSGILDKAKENIEAMTQAREIGQDNKRAEQDWNETWQGIRNFFTGGKK